MESLFFTSVSEAKDFIDTNNSKGIVLFGSVELIQEIKGFAPDHVVLCSTAGEYTKNGYMEGVITGFSYNKGQAEIVEILSPPIKSIEALKAGYDKVKNNKNSFMFLLCDGLAGQEESIMTTLFFMRDDFKIIGGSAGDYLKFKETLIYIGSKKVHAVALFFQMNKRTQLIKENIYQSTGTKLLVTEADPLKRTVYSFNNQKAATEYARAIGIQEDKLSNEFSNHPLGKRIKENISIASPMVVNNDKSITFYSQILPNTFVDVLEPALLEDSFSKTINSLEFKPSFILSVHCILRSLKFKEEKEWKNLDRHLIAACKNQTGFVSYGEQIYKKHLNQTMVLLAIE